MRSERLFVLLLKRYLLIYFTVEAYISALAGQFFVILCRSIGNFCFPFRRLTDLPPKFHKGLKTAKFWAIFPPKPDWTATASKRCNFSKPRWLGYHVLKFGTDWFPHLRNPSGDLGTQTVRKRKMAHSEANNTKTAKDTAKLLRVRSSAKTVVSSRKRRYRLFRGFSK